MEQPPMFNSVEDECRYWKERAKQYHKEWTDVKHEYDEYVEESRQMEAEMDATLDQKTSTIKDLTNKITSIEKENESLKQKLEVHTIEFASVERQLDTTKKERDSMKEYMRQLEQKNDDLERAHRILNESIVDFERMLDKAYEKNALLEMEVDEKEVLQEKLQRLMDETRDLKQELNVQTRYPINGSANDPSITSTTSMDLISNGVVNGDVTSSAHHDHITNMASITGGSGNSYSNGVITPTKITNDYNQQQSLKRKPFAESDNLLNGNAIPASSRTTALNIVADMLRKLNLDKALLCPDCSRFRCVCERPPQPSSPESSIQVPLSPQSDDISTTTNTTSIVAFGVTPSMSTSTSASSLSRASSRSFSNLHFRTNIFKRFAERMSGRTSPITNVSSLSGRESPPMTEMMPVIGVVNHTHNEPTNAYNN